MSNLHLIRTSAYQQHDLKQCLSIIKKNDALVLLDDGCYNLNHPLLQLVEDNIIYNVIDHSFARAVIDKKNISKPINLSQLTNLFFAFDKVITWQ
jgi:tRNA 2-thiouridine synthesizing protein B